MFTAFARCEVDGKDRHIALILEKGMKGFEVGERFDTMGLRGNDLRRLYFNDVKVPGRERARRARRGLPDRDADPQQRPHRPRHRLGRRDQGACSTCAIDHVKERRQFGQPLADFELVQDKIGWMVSYLFGLESMCYLTCGLVDARRRGLLARVGDLQGRRDRVPLVRGQPGDAAQGRRRLHARRALREDPPRHPDLPDLRGRQRRDARLHRALGDEAGRREALGARRASGSATRSARSACWPTTSASGSSARCAPTGSPRRTPSSPSTPTRSPTRSRSCAASPSRCCASTRRGSSSASSSRSGSPPRSPTSTRRSPCSRGSPRSSRTRASSPRARSATSPTPSAPAPPAACGANFRQIESNDDERMTRDRQARLQARRVRLRAVRGLSARAGWR